MGNRKSRPESESPLNQQLCETQAIGSITDLLDLVIGHILSYLDRMSLIAVAQPCVAMRDAAYRPQLWRGSCVDLSKLEKIDRKIGRSLTTRNITALSLEFASERRTAREVKKPLRACSTTVANITTILITLDYYLPLTQFGDFSSLQNVALDFILSDAQHHQLPACLLPLHNVENLIFIVAFENHPCDCFSMIMKSLPKLRELTLGLMYNFDPGQYVTCVPDILPNLKHLSLSTLRTTETEHTKPCTIKDTLRRFPALESVEIGELQEITAHSSGELIPPNVNPLKLRGFRMKRTAHILSLRPGVFSSILLITSGLRMLELVTTRLRIPGLSQELTKLNNLEILIFSRKRNLVPSSESGLLSCITNLKFLYSLIGIDCSRHMTVLPPGIRFLTAFDASDGQQPHQVLLERTTNGLCHRIRKYSPKWHQAHGTYRFRPDEKDEESMLMENFQEGLWCRKQTTDPYR